MRKTQSQRLFQQLLFFEEDDSTDVLLDIEDDALPQTGGGIPFEAHMATGSFLIVLGGLIKRRS